MEVSQLNNEGLKMYNATLYCGLKKNHTWVRIIPIDMWELCNMSKLHIYWYFNRMVESAIIYTGR